MLRPRPPGAVPAAQAHRQRLLLCWAVSAALLVTGAVLSLRFLPGSRTTKQTTSCLAVTNQTAAQLHQYYKPMLASTNAQIRAAAYECYAKALQQVHCRDLGPLDPNPNGLITALGGNPASVLVKIDPMPVYLNVYNASEDVVSGHLVKGEGWEESYIKAIIWALQQSEQIARASKDRSHPEPAKPVFLDIGANVGTYTLRVAAAGYNAIAFEAMSANQNLVRTAVCASHPDVRKRVTLHPFGLGAKQDTCFIVSADSNRGDGILFCGVKNEAELQTKLPSSEYRARGAINILRGDDVLDKSDNIRVIKIDVEGHEPYAFQGLSELIKRQTVLYILMEYNVVLLPKPPEGGVQHQFLLDMAKQRYRVSRESFEGPFMSESDMASLAKETLVNLYLVHNSAIPKLDVSQYSGKGALRLFDTRVDVAAIRGMSKFTSNEGKPLSTDRK